MRVTVVEGTVDEIRAAFPDLATGSSTVTTVPLPEAAVQADREAEENELATWLTSRRNPKVSASVEALIDGLAADGFLHILGPSKNTEDGKADYLRFYPQGPKRVGALVYVYPRTGRVDFRAEDPSFKDSNSEWAKVVEVNPVAPQNPYKACVRVTTPQRGQAAREIANFLRDQDVAAGA